MGLVSRQSRGVVRGARSSVSALACGLAALSTLLANETPEATAAATSATPCGESCRLLRRHDEIWLVSTRALGCPADAATPALQFRKYDGSGGWTDATLEAFLASDNPAIPTDFFVHGNFDSDKAVHMGLTVYGRYAAFAPADRPLRFVIWLWPTDRGKHPLQLTRMHARRSDADAFYLGWLVARIDHRVKIGLVGYSLGARVVTGAAHLLGGGQLIGLTLPLDAKAPRQTVRLTLLAAAEDCDWLSPGHPNGEALPFVDKMLLLNNGCDAMLKYYPRLDRCDAGRRAGLRRLLRPVRFAESCRADRRLLHDRQGA